jgi:hypothetical protein
MPTLKNNAKKIYVSGPYSSEPVVGTARAVEAAEKIFNAGHLPFIPHTHTMMWHFAYPHTYNEWIIFDLAWLKECDALVRLPGLSGGADIEVDYANQIGIPVFYSVSEAIAWANRSEEQECSQAWRLIAERDDDNIKVGGTD